jgi:hypothetical protein
MENALVEIIGDRSGGPWKYFFVSVEGTRLLALNYAQVHFFAYIWLNLRKIRMTFFLVPRGV